MLQELIALEVGYILIGADAEQLPSRFVDVEQVVRLDIRDVERIDTIRFRFASLPQCSQNTVERTKKPM